MTIRNRIALQFSLIVTSILVGFSVLVYLTSATYWQDEFYERLHQKALTTIRLLTEVDELNKRLVEIIGNDTSTALVDEKVLVFDASNDLVYTSTSTDDPGATFKGDLLQRVRERGDGQVGRWGARSVWAVAPGRPHLPRRAGFGLRRIR